MAYPGGVVGVKTSTSMENFLNLLRFLEKKNPNHIQKIQPPPRKILNHVCSNSSVQGKDNPPALTKSLSALSVSSIFFTNERTN